MFVFKFVYLCVFQCVSCQSSSFIAVLVRVPVCVLRVPCIACLVGVPVVFCCVFQCVARVRLPFLIQNHISRGMGQKTFRKENWRDNEKSPFHLFSQSQNSQQREMITKLDEHQ